MSLCFKSTYMSISNRKVASVFCYSQVFFFKPRFVGNFIRSFLQFFSYATLNLAQSFHLVASHVLQVGRHFTTLSLSVYSNYKFSLLF